eukprot:TRINITY_DN3533_c0_g1_i10.p2 TRINITY_DN3533_c0_g1~~TRINITY_DN3533_c0_g1_i10.p2  ORF type:complete len:120 (-),score=4.68 TRINITY_DN3533_c0_g1_i10:365-724(-)
MSARRFWQCAAEDSFVQKGRLQAAMPPMFAQGVRGCSLCTLDAKTDGNWPSCQNIARSSKGLKGGGRQTDVGRLLCVPLRRVPNISAMEGYERKRTRRSNQIAQDPCKSCPARINRKYK